MTQSLHFPLCRVVISTHILMKRMTNWATGISCRNCYFNSHPHEEDDFKQVIQSILLFYFNSHPHEEDDAISTSFFAHSNISTHILMKRMTDERYTNTTSLIISTHILMKRMTAILNKIFSFKIKLYIHYNILFAIFYIYNSILYPFSSPKRSYSGANDSANYCSLAFRTPRFPVPSLQIHFP